MRNRSYADYLRDEVRCGRMKPSDINRLIRFFRQNSSEMWSSHGRLKEDCQASETRQLTEFEV